LSDLTATTSVVDRGPVFVHVVPPSREYDHATIGVGSPVADAEKFTVDPRGASETDAGLVVITGAISGVTVRIAGLLVALPAALLTVASYSHPLMAPVAVTRSFFDVAPGTCVQLTPLSVETDHWALPVEASIVNVAFV